MGALDSQAGRHFKRTLHFNLATESGVVSLAHNGSRAGRDPEIWLKKDPEPAKRRKWQLESG
jgi:hypothetical protein